MVEHFEGVKSVGAGVPPPAFTFGCQIEVPQGPLYPGLYPQLQVLLTGIALHSSKQAPPAPQHLPGEVLHGMEKNSGVLGVCVAIL